jgi:hypothetical protein
MLCLTGEKDQHPATAPRWPEARAALKLEEDIFIRRESQPVAKLVRITASAKQRPRWDRRNLQIGSEKFPAQSGRGAIPLRRRRARNESADTGENDEA